MGRREAWKQSPKAWKATYDRIRDYQLENGNASPLRKEDEYLKTWYNVQHRKFISNLLEDWKLELWKALPVKQKKQDTPKDIDGLKGLIFEKEAHIKMLEKAIRNMRDEKQDLLANLGELLILLEENNVKLPKRIQQWGKKK